MALPWKFLLVDGTNVVIRYAFAMLPDVIANPDKHATKADIERVMAAVERAIRECAKQAACSHVIVCLDSGGAPWRKEILPEYKKSRNTITGPWVDMLHAWLRERGWFVSHHPEAEGDDVIATISRRLTEAGRYHAVLSGDSDLLALVADECEVWQFGKAGEPRFVMRPFSFVLDRYGVMPRWLPVYKALVGEPGDDIPGVRGVGPKKAVKILTDEPWMGEICNRLAEHSAEATEQFTRCLAVVALSTQVPLDPITPSHCVIPCA